MAEARLLGVNSTPTMFINGRRVVGQVAWQQLKAIFDHERGRSRLLGLLFNEVNFFFGGFGDPSARYAG